MAGSGVRVLSGLVCNYGGYTFISDNAGCFGGRPLPCNGSFLRFGSFSTYVVTEVVREYQAQVLVEDETPLLAALGRRITRPPRCVEVMMAGTKAAASKANAGEAVVTGVETTPTELPEKSGRAAKFPYEKTGQNEQLGMPREEVPLEGIVGERLGCCPRLSGCLTWSRRSTMQPMV